MFNAMLSTHMLTAHVEILYMKLGPAPRDGTGQYVFYPFSEFMCTDSPIHYAYKLTLGPLKALICILWPKPCVDKNYFLLLEQKYLKILLLQSNKSDTFNGRVL